MSEKSDGLFQTPIGYGLIAAVGAFVAVVASTIVIVSNGRMDADVAAWRVEGAMAVVISLLFLWVSFRLADWVQTKLEKRREENDLLSAKPVEKTQRQVLIACDDPLIAGRVVGRVCVASDYVTYVHINGIPVTPRDGFDVAVVVVPYEAKTVSDYQAYRRGVDYAKTLGPMMKRGNVSPLVVMV